VASEKILPNVQPSSSPVYMQHTVQHETICTTPLIVQGDSIICSNRKSMIIVYRRAYFSCDKWPSSYTICPSSFDVLSQLYYLYCMTKRAPLLQSNAFLNRKMHKNACSESRILLGLGELATFIRSPSSIKGDYFLREGKSILCRSE